MPVLIRNLRTGRYYAGHKQWMIESTDAFSFQSRTQALNWIHTVAMRWVEVVTQKVNTAPALVRSLSPLMRRASNNATSIRLKTVLSEQGVELPPAVTASRQLIEQARILRREKQWLLCVNSALRKQSARLSHELPQLLFAVSCHARASKAIASATLSTSEAVSVSAPSPSNRIPAAEIQPTPQS